MLAIHAFDKQDDLPLCSCGVAAEFCLRTAEGWLWRCFDCTQFDREEYEKETKRGKPMNDKLIAKELPSTEYSLKSISWHLKVLVDEIKKITAKLEGSSGMPF